MVLYPDEPHAVPYAFVDVLYYATDEGYPVADDSFNPYIAFHDWLRSQGRYQHNLNRIKDSVISYTTEAAPPPTAAVLGPWENRVPDDIWSRMSQSEEFIKKDSLVVLKVKCRGNRTQWHVAYIRCIVIVAPRSNTPDLRYCVSKERDGTILSEFDFPARDDREQKHEPATFPKKFVYKVEEGNGDAPVYYGRTHLIQDMNSNHPAPAETSVGPTAGKGYGKGKGAGVPSPSMQGSFHLDDAVTEVKNDKLEKLYDFYDNLATPSQKKLFETYICPISRDIVRTPVTMRNITGRGVLFEYAAIKNWLIRTPNMEVCPKTQQKPPPEGWRLVKCLDTIERLEDLADYFQGTGLWGDYVMGADDDAGQWKCSKCEFLNPGVGACLHCGAVNS